MVEFYYGLVLAGKRTCDVKNTKVKQVPEKHLSDVLEMLKANGYDANGKTIK